MLRGGWANVYVYGNDLERLPRYRRAPRDARDFDDGVFATCDGDFLADPERAPRGRAQPRHRAHALFVTTKTVEVHLSSAYRKLGICSRAQLGAALAPARWRP